MPPEPSKPHSGSGSKIFRRFLSRPAAYILAGGNGLLLTWSLLLLVISGARYLYGNDQPLFEIFLTLALGFPLSLAFVAVVVTLIRMHRTKLAAVMLGASTLFNLLALPVARWITKIEEEERYKRHGAERVSTGVTFLRSPGMELPPAESVPRE